MTPWLAAVYCVLALGLGWSLAGSGPWRRRAFFIVAAPPLALALWLFRPNPAGWPTAAGLPAHSSLVSALVQEPDPATAARGRIYLWLDVGAGAPRAFKLPYSLRLHRQVERAMARLTQQRSVEVTARRGRRRAAGGRHTNGTSSSVRFTTGAPPGLPPKR